MGTMQHLTYIQSLCVNTRSYMVNHLVPKSLWSLTVSLTSALPKLFAVFASSHYGVVVLGITVASISAHVWNFSLSLPVLSEQVISFGNSIH